LSASETKSASEFGSRGPILPRDSVAGRALIAVIAIMAFLAALTVGAVRIAHTSTDAWHSELASEITIQVKPSEGRNLEAEVQKAVALAQRTPGVTEARAYTKQESEKLLEPWLGSSTELQSLPVPRLIRVRVESLAPENIADLQRALSENVAGAALNDHRAFSSRLATISSTATLTGMTILVLVLLATVLSVSFATRGAVAANRPVLEVLHFVGARDSYIANILQRHFLEVGLQGGLIGGGAAALLFALARFGARLLDWLPGNGDVAFLFGSFSLDARGYLEIAAIVIFVGAVTAFSARLTVYSTLRNID
jgi:cell division transport system permease protein